MTDFVNLPPKRAALLQGHATLPVRIIRCIRIPFGLRGETAGFGKAELSLPAGFALYRDRLIAAYFAALERGILRMKNRAAHFITAMSVGAGKTVRHAKQQQKE